MKDLASGGKADASTFDRLRYAVVYLEAAAGTDEKDQACGHRGVGCGTISSATESRRATESKMDPRWTQEGTEMVSSEAMVDPSTTQD